MWQYITELFKQGDLRKRIIFTVFILSIYRFIAQVPLSIVDTSALQKFFSSNQLFGLLDIFSGGALSSFSIALMGVGPYITASIIMQLLVYVIPQLESLQKEGQQGQQIINQYTRLLAIPFGFIQSFGLITVLKSQGVISPLTPFQLVSAMVIATATTIFLMWLGELISEQGIGNGISLIITTGIIAGIPVQIKNTLAIVAGGGIVDTKKLIGFVAFGVIAIATVAFIVFIQDSVRRIPVSYARRVIGRRSLGGADTYLPIKINAAGVIPIIFALSVIVFPGLVARYLADHAKSQTIVHAAKSFYGFLNPSSIAYGILYFILVVTFTYIYTSIIFKPNDIAENLQKQGGFIPGIRPGGETSRFLNYIMQRLTLPGALFLGIIALLPFIIQSLTQINTLILGGTGILIIVSVVLETANQIKAYLATSNYDKYGA